MGGTLMIVGASACVIGVVLAFFMDTPSEIATALGALLTGIGMLWWQFNLRTIIGAGVCFALGLSVVISAVLRERQERVRDRMTLP